MTTRWYEKLTNGEESLFKKIDVSDDAIPICLEEKHPIEGEKPIKKYAVFRSAYALFRECIQTSIEKRCFFEIIRGGHYQKHYVDIDIDLEDDKFTEKYPHSIEEKINISKVIVSEYVTAMLKIKPEIQPTDIMVFNSNSEKKRSYHIIVDRWCFASATQNKEFFQEIMEYIPLPHRKYFDNRMYKCIQQFRIFLSTKCGKNRVKNIDPQSTWKCSESITDTFQLLKEMFFASLITVTEGTCRVVPLKYKEKIEYVPSRDMENNELSACLKLFRKFKDTSNFEVLDLKGTIIPLKRRSPSYCEVCQRLHDNENPFLYLSFDSNLYFNCRRNDNSTLIGNILTDINNEMITNEADGLNNNYVTPSIGYDLNISTFVDNGILDTTSKVENKIDYFNECSFCEEKSIKSIDIPLFKKREIKKNEVTMDEISEFSDRINEAKKKYTNGKKFHNPDRILSKTFNSIALI